MDGEIDLIMDSEGTYTNMGEVRKHHMTNRKEIDITTRTNGYLDCKTLPVRVGCVGCYNNCTRPIEQIDYLGNVRYITTCHKNRMLQFDIKE